MKKIIYITLLFFSLISFGQGTNDKISYLDSLGIETDSINFKIKRVIEDFGLEKKTYTVKEYNTDNKLLVSKEVNGTNYVSLNGEYIEYFTNGNKKKKLTYKDHQEIGEVRTWYSNGNLQYEGDYKLIDDKSELYVKNFWDENGTQKVINGDGIFIETERETKKDTLQITGELVKGRKNGVWKNLKEDYPIIEELYKDGKLVSGKATHSENETFTYSEVYTNASPKEGIREFRIKISRSIRMPDIENPILIKTTTRFTVDKEGNLKDIKILSFNSPLINDEIIRILKKEARWKPAFFRGKAVNAFYTLPINANIGGF